MLFICSFSKSYVCAQWAQVLWRTETQLPYPRMVQVRKQKVQEGGWGSGGRGVSAVSDIGPLE